LRVLTQHPALSLAYVSGRDLSLLKQAIQDYDLPNPHYAIGDVGTTIYEIHDDVWRPWQDWAEEIAPDWGGRCHDELAAIFQDIEILRLQETEKQNSYKLSYYAPENSDRDALLTKMDARLKKIGVCASLIWSIDEAGISDCSTYYPNALPSIMPSASSWQRRASMKEIPYSPVTAVTTCRH